MGNTFEELKDGYEAMFGDMVVTPSKLSEVDAIVNTIVAHSSTYKAIQQSVDIPWQTIGIIHSLEGSLNFKTHLHNGDPLTARTVHYPPGRPKVGNPPFTFQESAIDALTFEGFAHQSAWDLAHTLYRLEKYNGLGYRALNVPTPYLWSYSNHYVKGKYTETIVNGKPKSSFDPNLVSKQCGGAVLLRRMVDRQIVAFDDQPSLLTVVFNGQTLGNVSAFEQDGNSWIGARALAQAIPGLSLDSVLADPFTISMSFDDGQFHGHRDFPARLFRDIGHVDASDLVRDLMRWSLDYDGTKTPSQLTISRP